MFALIFSDLRDTGKREASNKTTGPVPGHPDKPYWVPVVEETDDTSSSPNRVVSPWVETIQTDRVLRTRTIRDKTAGELEAEDQARFENAFNLSGTERATLRLVFELVKAMKTGDKTFFDSVTSKQKFKDLFVSLSR